MIASVAFKTQLPEVRKTPQMLAVFVTLQEGWDISIEIFSFKTTQGHSLEISTEMSRSQEN
jgi:hypothetical protein